MLMRSGEGEWWWWRGTAATIHRCGYCQRPSVKSILSIHGFHIHQATFDCIKHPGFLRQPTGEHSLNSQKNAQMVAGEDRLVLTPINPRPRRLSHSIGRCPSP